MSFSEYARSGVNLSFITCTVSIKNAFYAHESSGDIDYSRSDGSGSRARNYSFSCAGGDSGRPISDADADVCRGGPGFKE